MRGFCAISGKGSSEGTPVLQQFDTFWTCRVSEVLKCQTIGNLYKKLQHNGSKNTNLVKKIALSLQIL